MKASPLFSARKKKRISWRQQIIAQRTFQEKYSQVARSGKQNKFPELRFIFSGVIIGKFVAESKEDDFLVVNISIFPKLFCSSSRKICFCFPDRATWEYLSWNVGSSCWNLQIWTIEKVSKLWNWRLEKCTSWSLRRGWMARRILQVFHWFWPRLLLSNHQVFG